MPQHSPDCQEALARNGEGAVDIVGHLFFLHEGGAEKREARQSRAFVALFADGLYQVGYPLGGKQNSR
jgi:hypothetical protein